jgi:Domain of unknown function (DUF1816)
MNDFLSNSLNLLGLAWWVEVTTDSPRCTYYFGPFESAEVADLHHSGYIEDLAEEGAQNIVWQIRRCKPKELTVNQEPETAMNQ